MCVRAYVCVCIRLCIYAHVSLEYVKIYLSIVADTFDKNSSLAIFDQHLVW